MLITTSAGTWGIPKGRIDGDETAAEAADRESHEEAGVVGCIDFPALGTYVHPRRESRQPVEVFSLRVDRVLTRWPEATRRKRLWVPVEHARRLIPHSDLAALLTRLEAILTADRAPLRKAG
jgi:ADP-ribose pyrophosphatase YjhB (NUDIX family)